MCLKLKPQNILKLKMISPAQGNKYQNTKSIKVAEGWEGSSHQLHLPLHTPSQAPSLQNFC